MSAGSTASGRIPVAVLGATGYTGVELLRLLARHPMVDLVCLSSEQYRGRRMSEVYPFLTGLVDRELVAPEAALDTPAEIVFTALPHGAAAPHVQALLARERRVIDLSADFRIRDAAVYARWYGEHAAPALLAEAVYGLVEWRRDAIRGARLVANPGCYPTTSLLGLLPLARAGLLTEPVVINAASGTTGAGRSAKVEQLFAEVNDNFRAYGVGTHRHRPEIDQELGWAGATAGALFTPHLLPVSRGILSTMYVRLAQEPPLAELFGEAYADEPFIVLRGGTPPELHEVRGTNRCAIGWYWDAATSTAIVMSATDNLVKGAAGQAVQSMNLLLGFPETTGLEAPALAL
jgi:N-acetyl-gamma-glutamyl-phosphate reductase